MITVTIPANHFVDYIDRVEYPGTVEVDWDFGGARKVRLLGDEAFLADLMEDAEYYATEPEYASYMRTAARALVRSLVKQGVPRQNPNFGAI